MFWRSDVHGLKPACFMLSIAMLMIWASPAHALRVTVKRVVFEGAKRANVLTIINDSDSEQTFRFGWKNVMMTADSPATPIPDGQAVPGLLPAQDMVRYSPRRITIPAGGAQQVRMMVRRPEGLADGEYRSHFTIQPEQPVAPALPESEAGTGAGISLTMLTSVTFPVIVRQGSLSAAAGIEGLSVSRDGEKAHVRFSLTRTGSRSLYGHLEMVCEGVENPVHTARGIAVYTEAATRNMDYALTLPPSCTTLTVRYRADEDDLQYSGQILAEASSPVTP